MGSRIHVLSQLSGLASYLRKQLLNRVANDVSLKSIVGDIEIVDVQPKNGEAGKFVENITLAEEDFKKLYGAQILLIDNNFLPMVLKELSNQPELKSIRWTQNSWAGVDGLFKDNLPEIIKKNNLIVTRFSGTHFGHAMFDFVFCQIVAHERMMFDLFKMTKIDKMWDNSKKMAAGTRRTDELKVAILGGTGAIGSYISKKLSGIGVDVLAFGRSSRSQAEISEIMKDTGISKYSNKLNEILPHVDYIVNVLPFTNFTEDLLSNGVLKMCSERKPVFINVGRGNVISEQSIIDSLDNKWISYAILDVFLKEPLPTDSPLWLREDVLISPHVAGVTRTNELVKSFLDNYINYVTNKPLNLVVDFDLGY